MKKILPLALALPLLFTAAARAATDVDARAKDLTKSLVIVEYTARNENISREETGQGIVISKDGVILVSGTLIPESYPKEWIKDLKIRIPSKNFSSVPVKMLGRTRDRLFAFLKADETLEAVPFTPADAAPVTLGEGVFSVALLSKSGGYQTYVGISRVKALLDLSHRMANTDSFGLTRGTSPVFDMDSGKFLGITFPSLGESMIMRDANGIRGVQLIDEEQSSAFLPADETAALFKNVPTAAFESPRPWLAVDGITGISEDMRALKNIKQVSGVMIGSVIANEPADKAGVEQGDIVLGLDGKPFSTSPVPDLMVMHFSRAIEKHAPGDTLTLNIQRDGKTMDIRVKLGATPKTAGEVAHHFSARIGVVTRELVFSDAYARRLPQDTKGVMVALVKNGAPASLGSTPLHVGDLIQKVNDQSVDDEAQFLEAMKKIEGAADMKEAVFVVIQPDGNTQVCHIDLTK